MKISSITVYHVRLPFRLTIAHHLAARNFSENLIVKITTAEGIMGYGEGIPREYVTGETIESAFDAVASRAGFFSGRSFSSFSDLRAWIGVIGTENFWQKHLSAFCALELALLDAAGKHCNKPVYKLLKTEISPKDRVRYSGVIPFSQGKSLEAFLAQIKDSAIPEVKVKVGKEVEWEALNYIREVLGENVDIRVDANCAWERSKAVSHIKRLAELGIVSVEQPLAAWDKEGLKAIKEAASCNIIVDEGLSRIQDAHDLAMGQGCDIFNIRLSKCGGLINSMKIHGVGRSAGIRSQLGAQVGESGILSAAGRHFAALHPDLVYHEGSFGSMLLEKDITRADIVFGPRGEAPILTQPGLGVEIDEGRLDELTIRKAEVI